MKRTKTPRADVRIPVTVHLSLDDHAFVLGQTEGQGSGWIDEVFAFTITLFREHIVAYGEWCAKNPEAAAAIEGSRDPHLDCTITYSLRTN